MADGGVGETMLAEEVVGSTATTTMLPSAMTMAGAGELGSLGTMSGLGGLSTVGSTAIPSLGTSGLAGLANVAPEAAAQTSAALAEASPTFEATQEAVRNQVLNNAVSSSGAGAPQMAGNVGNAASSSAFNTSFVKFLRIS